ncbi:MAG: ABC-type transport system involved in resistance to organic solvent periplasmic component-like [Acidimicrobiales bacterium]|jgi:phospholipid/cholesterol/gamma-HCH transport system substrate-binding protein|nr:ABC-type transport system involved in resistance to organic solvent periplasmic component-like [Acidimicrobiales bacterium]
MSRRTRVNLVTFVLVSLVFLGWAVNNIVSVDRIARPYHIYADVASSVGLLPGSEVDYLGVTYGSVDRVVRVPGAVRIHLKIDRNKKVPEGSTANVLRKSVLGEQFVDFTPPPGYAGGGPFYRAGTVVPEDKTTVPLEFSELLRSAGRLVASVSPDAVQTLVHEAAVGLSGRADSFRALTDAGDRISQTLAERTAALDRLASNNTRLTHTITDHRDALSAITDLRNLADSLKNAKGNTDLLLERGSQLLQITADLVAAHKGDLDCDLKTLTIVTDVTTTPARLAGLRTVLTVAPQAFDQLLDAGSDIEPGPAGGPARRWIRVGLITNPRYNPAPQFVPPRQLPPVAVVAACSSTLKPVGNYTAGVPLAATGTRLPATGGTALLALALAMVGAALVLRVSAADLRSAE